MLFYFYFKLILLKVGRFFKKKLITFSYTEGFRVNVFANLNSFGIKSLTNRKGFFLTTTLH